MRCRNCIGVVYPVCLSYEALRATTPDRELQSRLLAYWCGFRAVCIARGRSAICFGVVIGGCCVFVRGQDDFPGRLPRRRQCAVRLAPVQPAAVPAAAVVGRATMQGV